MDKPTSTKIEKLVGKWGPVPSWGPPPTEEQQKAGRAVQAMLRLSLDARYYLGGRKLPDELGKLLDWVPSSRKDFERARAEFHQKVEAALLGRGDSSYLDFLADQIAIFEERKDPPALPRGERRTIVLEECFVHLWEYGTNWIPRKEFFNLVCAALRNQGYAPITYRHFLRILENTGLGKHFPPMRRRRKRPRRLNGSIDS